VGEKDSSAAGLIAALETAWAEVRSRHAELPAAVIITGSGSGRPNALTLGHHAAERWRHTGQLRDLPEILIGGEGLERGAADVLGTLLHEAAHALAEARGIKDTSREGRYHNRRYKALAEELGLHVEQDARRGWTTTSLPEGTACAYAHTIAALQQAITLYRHREPARRRRRSSRNPIPCLCACGRRIAVARSVLRGGSIICGVCSQPFRPATQRRDPAEPMAPPPRATGRTSPARSLGEQ
jgi:hypothetical protein